MGIPIASALPYLRVFNFFGCCKLDQRVGAGRRATIVDGDEALLDEESDDAEVQELDFSSSDEDNDRLAHLNQSAVARRSRMKKKDPVVVYGPGISNYFRLQEVLMGTFFVFSILAVIQCYIFHHFRGLGKIENFVHWTAENSIGNMGWPTTFCTKEHIDWINDDGVTLEFACQQSTVLTAVVSSGMMLDSAFPMGRSEAVLDCYVNKTDINQMATFEMAQFRGENFDRKFNENCLGKQNCAVKYKFEEFARLPPKVQRLNMILFAQAECTSTDEVLLEKNIWGGAAACIGLLIMLWYTFTIQYLYRTDVIDEKLADLKVVTVDDYTVQTRLPAGLYKEFLKDRKRTFNQNTIRVLEFEKAMSEAIKS